MSNEKTYCGFIAIVGRPNVGKSTLLNKILGQKVSITSCKPHTTRHQIIGIHSEGPFQAIYVDTPGLHIEEKRSINRLMNRTTSSVMRDVEFLIFMVEGIHWTNDDEMIVSQLHDKKYPILLVINKIDNLSDKTKLLPHIHFLSKKMNFFDVVPISAKNGFQIDTISNIVRKYLPVSKHHFPKNYITNRSQRFMAEEIIREKLTRFLGEELPYSISVNIERFITNNRDGYHINSLIFVERNSQKKMVIGTQGANIKNISIAARQDIEKMFAVKVHLVLWVKVKSGWSNDERVLRSLGYIDDL